MACKSCRYWFPRGGSESGFCRRFPPTPLLIPEKGEPGSALHRSEDIFSHFPITTPDGWCGEHAE